MLRSILLGLLLVTLMCESALCASSVENVCTAKLSSNFTEDCNNGHLKSFSQCLRDTEILNPMAISDKLNKQYCQSEDCNFSCTGNSFTVYTYK